MATENVRVVGYLPPSYHKKLREYMQEQSLTESAALVRIVKDFFDGSVEGRLVADKDAIAQLRTEMVQLQKRLAILEEAVLSGRRQFNPTKRTSRQYGPPVVPPQTLSDLARRLGVGEGTVEEAYQKGEAQFRDWSRRLDPSKKSWRKQGDLFHPISE